MPPKPAPANRAAICPACGWTTYPSPVAVSTSSALVRWTGQSRHRDLARDPPRLLVRLLRGFPDCAIAGDGRYCFWLRKEVARLSVFGKLAARRRRKAHERYLQEREWQRMLAEKNTAETVQDVAMMWAVAGQATSGPFSGR